MFPFTLFYQCDKFWNAGSIPGLNSRVCNKISFASGYQQSSRYNYVATYRKCCLFSCMPQFFIENATGVKSTRIKVRQEKILQTFLRCYLRVRRVLIALNFHLHLSRNLITAVSQQMLDLIWQLEKIVFKNVIYHLMNYATRLHQ